MADGAAAPLVDSVVAPGVRPVGLRTNLIFVELPPGVCGGGDPAGVVVLEGVVVPGTMDALGRLPILSFSFV